MALPANKRYNRQILLSEIGEEGQEKLAHARVLIVGVGGLGSPIALYLAGAGVGTLGLMDGDTVDESNLQRQVLYAEKEVGLSKAEQAAKRLKALNESLTYHVYSERLTKENAQAIVSQYDIIVDGCDNFATRYLMNDVCVELGKIYVFGAIRAFEGQVSVFNYQGGPTFRTFFPDEVEMYQLPPLPKGVMGVTPGIVGCAEANEVIKLICGYGDVLSGKLWHIDLKTMETQILQF